MKKEECKGCITRNKKGLEGQCSKTMYPISTTGQGYTKEAAIVDARNNLEKNYILGELIKVELSDDVKKRLQDLMKKKQLEKNPVKEL